MNVPASGTTATWELDAAFVAGAIQGDINFPGAATPSSGGIQLYNSSYTSLGNKSYQGNGSYEYTNLLPSSYRLYNTAYFPGSHLYFYRHNTVAEAGVITQVDYTENLSMALFDLNPTGFLSLDNISGGYVQARWTAPNPNPNNEQRNLYGQFDQTTNQLSGAVTSGEWKFDRISINGYDYSTRGVYLSYALGIYDYQPITHTFAGGETENLGGFDFDTTQTELTFDVIEPAGATEEILISSANINGYVTTYENGAPYQQLSMSASVSGGAKPRQRVRIVGIPGTYNLQTYGYVEGSRVSFGNFSLELKEPLPTPVGTDVTVEAGTGVELVFDNVVEAGVSTAAQLPVGPALPAGFSPVVNNDVNAYYSISTTATFDGYVDVTIDYAEDAVAAEDEADLKLFYFDEASETWIDVTIEVHEVNNTITGTAPELALFAIGISSPPTVGDLQLPAEIVAGEEFTVTAQISDANSGDEHTAIFDWGDGTTSEGVIDPATGLVTGAHTYEQGGDFDVSLTVVDAAGNEVTESFEATATGNVDATAPVITVEIQAAAEATSPDGAVVEFDVSASDETDGSVTVSTSALSGSVFPLGTTVVTATATDTAGNEATTEFEVVVQDTTAPELSAPVGLVVEATGADGTIAVFTAAASDVVSGDVSVDASIASGSSLPLGTTTIGLSATDGAGNTSESSFTVTVEDTTAPELSVPADLVLEATSADGAVVTFDATASDLVDGDVTVESSIASGSTLPLGETTISLTTTDAAGNVAEASFTVTVQDTTAPEVASVALSIGVLWPANHKMVALSFTVDANDAGGEVTSKIVSITSNEPDNGKADGNTINDTVITGDLTANLRAERSGKGTGRVYTVTIETTDAAGNVTSSTTTVSVPKSQGKKSDKSASSNKKGKGK